MPRVIMKTFGRKWDQKWMFKNGTDMDCRAIESPMEKRGDMSKSPEVGVVLDMLGRKIWQSLLLQVF